jgi:glycosyltransferase involved in cell wall biosynthesis
MHMLRISLITLGDPNRLTGGYLYHRRMAELAPRFDARITFASFPGLPFPLPALAAPSVFRRVRRSTADAIVLDSIGAAYLGPWLALTRGSGIPLVAMLHQPPGGIDSGVARSAIQAWLDGLAYARCRRLLVASEALALELETAGVRRGRMLVVPPGRDIAKPSDCQLADIRRGRRCAFLCVANWVEHKSILGLLDAFAWLPWDLGILHLVGDTNVDPRYARLVRSRLSRPDVVDRVVVHGPVPRETVAAFYRSADVFVLPSIKETYGTVYGEAMAAGLPVVGWRAGNLPHLAEDGKEGRLLPPGDVLGLACALEQLANDDEVRRELGNAAARRALKFPTWEHSAAMFFGAVREAAGEPGCGPIRPGSMNDPGGSRSDARSW